MWQIWNWLREPINGFGKYLTGVVVNDIVKIALALIGFAASAASIWSGYVSDLENETNFMPWLIGLSPCLLIIGLLFYFAVVYFSTQIIHWIGSKIVLFSKFYPSLIYDPKIDFRLVPEKRNLVLHIQSHKKNENAFLYVQFSGIKAIGSTDSVQKKINLRGTSILNKLMFDKEITSGGSHKGAIGEFKDEKLRLIFTYFENGFFLDEGKYVYIFDVWGTHKGVNFPSRTYSLPFSFNSKGEFEV